MVTSPFPEKLRQYPQWVVWRLEDRDGRPTKVPYDAKNVYRKASSTDPSTWSTHDAADVILNSGFGFSGVGFVFTKDDPFIGIDFDHCIDENGNLNKCAYLNATLFASYTEYSQSGTGLHVIGQGYNPAEDKKGHKNGDVEFYTEGRFFAMTGKVWNNQNKINIIPQTFLRPFYEKYFSVPVKATPKKELDLSDNEIIKKCSTARNSTKFMNLWSGNTIGYPSASEADLALCSILAFYTQDVSQLERLMLNSGLCREKSGRKDYMQRTIQKATSIVKEKYGDKKKPKFACKVCGQAIRFNDPNQLCWKCK